MKFTLIGELSKIVWQDEHQSRYLLNIKSEKKTWTVWSNIKPDFGVQYVINGTVTESPDKKIKDQNGKAIYRANFNAESWTDSSGSMSVYNEDIPF